jgi:hypothetical protein
MMTYRDLLAQRTWWELRAIALAHRWHFDTHWSKAQAVDHLAEKLTQTPVLRSMLDVLDPKALEVLQVLHLTQAPRSARQFLETFGPIRPYKPWQDDERYHPWRNPISPAEKLWHLGLIFEVKCSTGTLMVLPHEVRHLLPMGTPQPEPPDTPPPESTLILDLVHLLAYLQGHRVRALHGRWLAPSHVRALNWRFAHPDPRVAEARSELQTGYLRFVHYLAECAGLVAPVLDDLMPTPTAWTWRR